LNLRAYLGFVALIQLQDASVVQSAKVVLCSIVSLAGSASVGPEAGFSAIGGGMAALLYKYILRWDKRKDRTRYTYVILAGMAGACVFSCNEPERSKYYVTRVLRRGRSTCERSRSCSFSLQVFWVSPGAASGVSVGLGVGASADGVWVEPGAFSESVGDGGGSVVRRVFFVGKKGAWVRRGRGVGVCRSKRLSSLRSLELPLVLERSNARTLERCRRRRSTRRFWKFPGRWTTTRPTTTLRWASCTVSGGR